MIKASLVLTIAIAGCGKKNDVAEYLQSTRAELAKPKPNLGLVRTDCIMAKLDKIDRTQPDAKELIAICEHDYPLAEAKQSIDTSVELTKDPALLPESSGCKEADLNLDRLDAKDPAVKEVRAKWDAVCKPKRGVAEKPAGADAAVIAVTDALPEIERLVASTDPFAADAKCIVLIEETETLLASTDAKAREVGDKIDRLCNYAVPLRTIEAVKDCSSRDVHSAVMNLGLHKKLEQPAVMQAIAAWNTRCPSNTLAPR
jgi:hypothetical protein